MTSETYRYDAGSQRILKVRIQQTGNTTQTQRVVYLPGLELRLRYATDGTTEKERLQVIAVGDTGRAQVRVLHWESGKPTDISNDQVRYSYDTSPATVCWRWIETAISHQPGGILSVRRHGHPNGT